MLSIQGTDSLSLRSDPDIAAALDLEQRIKNVDEEIRRFLNIKKKLGNIEDELANANLLIDSGIGSKSDQKALRQTKKEIRQRRVELRNKLQTLPGLQEERSEIALQLKILRRSHGLL